MRLFIRIGIALTFVLSARTAFAQSKEEAFTRDLLPRLQTAIPSHRFEYVAPLEIRDSTSGSMLYPDRIFGYVSANPKDATAAQQSYIAQLTKAIAEADKPISKHDVRLAVRHAPTIKSALDAMAPGSKAAYPRNFTADLIVVPVIDTPSTVRYVNERNLSNLGLTEEEVVAWGTKNLRATQNH